MGTGPTDFPLYTEKKNLKGWEHCDKKKKKRTKATHVHLVEQISN